MSSTSRRGGPRPNSGGARPNSGPHVRIGPHLERFTVLLQKAVRSMRDDDLAELSRQVDALRWPVEWERLRRAEIAADQDDALPRRGKMHGAVEMQWADGTHSYVILPIHEFRNDGARFRLYDPSQQGSHLLSAGDVRANWEGWVSDLVDEDQIVDKPPEGVEVY